MSTPRNLATEDRRKLIVTANEWARSGSFVGLRTRAFMALGLSSGLRLGELCNLDLTQVLDQTERGFRVRRQCYLRNKQSKGARSGKRIWNSAGVFYVHKAARACIRAYLRAAIKRGWVEWPPAPDAPLFVTVHGRQWNRSAAGGIVAGAGANSHERLSRRSAQHSWYDLQKRARIADTYNEHCLRHEFMTRVADTAANAFDVAALGRCDIRTALRYVHSSPHRLEQLSEAAQRAQRPRRAVGR